MRIADCGMRIEKANPKSEIQNPFFACYVYNALTVRFILTSLRTNDYTLSKQGQRFVLNLSANRLEYDEPES